MDGGPLVHRRDPSLGAPSGEAEALRFLPRPIEGVDSVDQRCIRASALRWRLALEALRKESASSLLVTLFFQACLAFSTGPSLILGGG